MRPLRLAGGNGMIEEALALRDLAWAKVQVEIPSVQSLLGTLIMISGLAIYAVFRKPADGHAVVAPGRD